MTISKSTWTGLHSEHSKMIATQHNDLLNNA